MKKSLIYVSAILIALTSSCDKQAVKNPKPVSINVSPSGNDRNKQLNTYQSYVLTPDPDYPLGVAWLGTYGGFTLIITSLSYDFADYPNSVNGVPGIGNASVAYNAGYVDQTYVKGSATYFVITGPAPVVHLAAYQTDLNNFTTAFNNWFNALPDNDIPPTPAPPLITSYVKSNYIYGGTSSVITATCKLIRLASGQYALASPDYPQPSPYKPAGSTPPLPGITPLTQGIITDGPTTYYIKGTNGYVTSISLSHTGTPTVTGFIISGTYTQDSSSGNFSYMGQVTRQDGSKFTFNVQNQDIF